MRQQIKVNDGWVDGKPEIGEWYRQQVSSLPDGDPVWQEQRNIEVTQEPEPIEIMITSITGALIVNSDNTKVTCKELVNITISGTLAIPDQLFSLPIRRDDGRLFLFAAQVTSGEFSVVVNFPTTGQFIYSDNECNIDLPYKVFAVNTVKLDVLRVI